jgi:glycosyltransferase involved in cell wall biosynthesis
MNYINNTDFLNLLKSCAVKIDNRPNNGFTLLNSLDYALLQNESHFINDNYYEYLVRNRRDILKLPYPALHLLDHCFKDPELLNSYFEKIEPLALREVRQEFRFFGTPDSQKVSKKLRPHKETGGYVLNTHLSNLFSKELQNIDLVKSKEEFLDLVKILINFKPGLKSFIRIELDSSNIDFFANFETLIFLNSLKILICFDFGKIDFLEDSEDLICLKIFEYLTSTDIDKQPFLILTKNFDWIDKVNAQKLLYNNFLFLESSMSDFYFPSFIPNTEVLGNLSNSYYGNFKFDGYFYFGDNSELYSELDEIYNNIVSRLDSTDVGTIIYVRELNIAGTEMLSNSFFDFLNAIGSRTILIYEKTGTMQKFVDLSHQNLLCLPFGLFGLQETLGKLYNLGYTNFVSFTSVNLVEAKIAEDIGFRSFIHVNETLEYLESVGILQDQIFDESNSRRSIIVNSKSVFSVNLANLFEIPTSVPSEFMERQINSYTRQYFGIESKIVIGTLASGILRKGIDRVQEILDFLPDNVVYLWVGEIDPKFSISSSKFIHSHFMPAANFYSIVDIYSCLSRNDPFPMSVTESLLRGIPVVAYDNESCGQINSIDFKDIVVSDGDPKSFVNNITNFKINNNLDEQLDFTNKISRRLKYSPQAYNKKNMNLMGLVSPGISVVLPYFNHQKYIKKRLESIIDQRIPIEQIIALNDASSDNGFTLVTNFLRKQDILVAKVLVNEINSGNVFKQWSEGVSNSTSEFIWITETDDFADPHFLFELIPFFQDPNVVLATSNSKLINSNDDVLGQSNHVFDHIKYPSRFRSRFTNSGLNEIRESIGIYNSIPNVSACIFRRDALQRTFASLGDYLFNFKYAGDWLIYIDLLTSGSIAYSPKSLNFFRQSQESVIKSADKATLLAEIIEVQNFAKNKIQYDEVFVNQQILYLESVKKHLDSF